MADENLVVDVTAEIVGERRQEWHDGFDAGLKQGTSRVLQSNPLAQMALELTLYRAALDVSAQRERLLQHWKSEAQMWQAECERVSADFSAFVEMAKRFAK